MGSNEISNDSLYFSEIESFGVDSKAHLQTLKMMFGRLAVKYCSDPIIPWYVFSLTFLPGKSAFEASWGVHRSPKILPFLVLNFSSSSFMYLVWLMKVTLVDCLICSPKKKVSSPIKFILNSSFRRLAKFSQRLALKLPKIMSST